MPFPAALVAGIVIVGQSAGIIGNIGNAIVAIDKAIPAIIDLKKLVPNESNANRRVLLETRRPDKLAHSKRRNAGTNVAAIGRSNSLSASHKKTLAAVER